MSQGEALMENLLESKDVSKDVSKDDGEDKSKDLDKGVAKGEEARLSRCRDGSSDQDIKKVSSSLRRLNTPNASHRRPRPRPRPRPKVIQD